MQQAEKVEKMFYGKKYPNSISHDELKQPKLPRVCHLLQHSARKQGWLIVLIWQRPHWHLTQKETIKTILWNCVKSF